ncbi:MAG: tRNA1(Val) (adenine(37)-N6)-methyltransferase [Candidatus Saccharibacteria bacterium]
MREHAREEVNLVYEGETLDDLVRDGLKVIQAGDGYRFSMDAVLLSHFSEAQKNEVVLDLGCGSGVMAILIASRQPDSSITGLEIQESLADRARRSLQLNRLTDRVNIITGNLRSYKTIFQGKKFSLIVTNPPFWRSGEGKTPIEQENLVARHEVEATLNDFIEAAVGLLSHRGRLALIQRADRSDEIIRICQEHRLAVNRIRFVHPKLDKPANLVLVEAVKGGRGYLKILPPLIVYGENGQYTPELLEIYFGKEELV